MDLFLMDRYQPDDQKIDIESSNEELLLKKLKQKISSKKKGLKSESTFDEPTSKKIKVDETDRKVPTKDDEKEPIVAEKTDQNDSSQLKKKKKKSKKKKNQLTVTDGFQVLGESLDTNKNKVQRVLPTWLAKPDFISVDLSDQQLPVEEMKGLDDGIRSQLKSNGVSYFFPVQRLVIPWLLKSERFRFFRPNDICVSAPTGSGKTLSFALPIVQALKSRIVPRVRALVILPVQELAAQVFKVFQLYCEGTNLKVRLVSGQKSFAQEQVDLVKKGNVGTFHSLVDILIATPGRIVDHIQKTEGFDLTHLRYLVIDEADRVMEDIQNDWLTHVENSVFTQESNRTQIGPYNVKTANNPANIPLQKLLFSATLSKDPEILQQLNLFEPKMFATSVNPDNIVAKNLSNGKNEFTTPMELKEVFVRCEEPQNKPLVLYTLLISKSINRVLIFTKSGDSSHSLAMLLKQFGLSADELSSKAQDKRSKVLSQFKNGQLDYLVCTDALARGIDIGTIDFVISYDLPPFVTTYIHRVGRTARAGKEGTAITIIDKREEKKFKTLMKEAGKTETVTEELLPKESLDKHVDLYEEARQKTAEILTQEKKEEKDRKKKASFGKRNEKKKDKN